MKINTNTLSERLTVTTTNGEVFTGSDSARMAALMYRRLGREMLETLRVWRLMHQNNCPVLELTKLVILGLALEAFDRLSHNEKAYANPDKKLQELADNMSLEFVKDWAG